MISADRARELLNYDPETGQFTWRSHRNGFVKAGAPAGSVKERCVQIKIDRRLYSAHRVAWLIMTGKWPVCGIDHINGDPFDNRFVNLRECNQSENSQNRKRGAANKSGYVGVSWHKASGKWRAQIKVNGRTYECGLFSEPALAHRAYLVWKARLHPFNPTVRAA